MYLSSLNRFEQNNLLLWITDLLLWLQSRALPSEKGVLSRYICQTIIEYMQFLFLSFVSGSATFSILHFTLF